MAATVEAEPRTDLGIRTLISGDGVRGVGALFVFATHVCLLADPVANNNLLSYGWAAPILGHIEHLRCRPSSCCRAISSRARSRAPT